MYALAIHGGAGAMPRVPFSSAREESYRLSLLAALALGEQVLKDDGAALDAVQAAVMRLEDDPAFNAGHGAVLTADGAVELDAAIMDGTELRAGAVAQVQHVRNPIVLARQVLDDAAHVFLVGEGAERFAREAGLSLVANDYFITEQRRQQYHAQRSGVAVDLDEPPLGTVGAVARDRAGHLAAATSTGGTAGKRSGRVGDSPVIGAGTYADDQTCAVSTTGHGEWFLRTAQAYDIAARLRYGGGSLASAVAVAIARLSGLGAAGGLIAVDPAGEIAIGRNTPIMFRASVRAHQGARVEIY